MLRSIHPEQMERSSGTDALLNESWTTPWLDDRVFPYWPQAARIGDLEDFLRWLVAQDSRRAALVLTHSLEFEMVHRLVTAELSRPQPQPQQQQQKPQPQRRRRQQRPQQPPRCESQSARPPSSSSTSAAGTRARARTGARPAAASSKALTSPSAGGGGGSGKRRGSGGGAIRLRDFPSSTNVAVARAGPSSLSRPPREPSAAAKSKRLSVASRGVGGGGGRGDPMTRSWPPSAAAAGKKQHGALHSRHSTSSAIPPPPTTMMARSGGSRGPTIPRLGAAAQPPAWSPSTSKAATVVADAYRRASTPSANKSRPWNRNSLEGWVEGAAMTERGAGASGSIGFGSGSRGAGSRGSETGGGASGRSRNGGARSTGPRACYAAGRASRAPRPEEPSSWGPMAVVAAAAAAGGRTAVARRAAEAAVAKAEAAAAAKATGTGRGKRGRGGLSPEKHPSAKVTGLATGRLRRSSPPLAWPDGNSNGGNSSGHGVKGVGVGPIQRYPLESTPVELGLSAPVTPALGFGDDAVPAGASDLPLRAGNRTDRPREDPAVAERVSPERHQPVWFQRSDHPLLGNIDEEKEGIAPPPPGEEGEEEAEENRERQRNKTENDGESWLRMRDPVSQREFWFDPETRAAEWEGGGAMEDAPGGMGLGLLSREDREYLKGKFERRQRRVRRASGGPGGAVPAAGGGSRGTAGLREQVLRKLTLEAGSGETGAGGRAVSASAVAAAPVRRGAATHGVFFS